MKTMELTGISGGALQQGQFYQASSSTVDCIKLLATLEMTTTLTR